MGTVDIEKAVEAAKEVVREAHSEGKLQHLTNRIVRQEVEQYLELAKGALEEKSHKKRLNEAITATVEEVRANVSGTKDPEPKKVERPVQIEDAQTKPSSSVKKRKSEGEEADAGEGKRNKPRSSAPEKAPVSEGSKKKRKVGYKSKETVELDSNDENHPIPEAGSVSEIAVTAVDIELSDSVEDIEKEALGSDDGGAKIREAKEVSRDADAKLSLSARKSKSESEKGEAKKRKPRSKPTEKVPSSEGPKTGRGGYKSKETVELDSDNEEFPEPEVKPAADTVTPASSVKGKGKRPANSEDENDASEDPTPPKKRKTGASAGSGSKKSRAASTTKKTDHVSSKLPVSRENSPVNDDEKSESELSVLLDGPPTKRKKEASKAKNKKSKAEPKGKKRREKKGATELSPDEEQIKKLKSLMVACGVRKMWSKELKDCDTPAKQIAHLRGLLTELGMKGRFSLEQAKAIKEKRELAREMEDVREFAQKYTGGRPKRSGAAQGKPAGKDEESNGEESDIEDAGASSIRQPRNARQSIMAFLGDESE
ncbi:hypothetical protein DFH11DRAFT_1580214 [Phellopilus nigrolimitatus]|nr:hypothetical protein DFH11DRAFT_1580214 [Phellopilus nigrolimitatus]